jgi:hypothetical protein
MRLSHTGHPDSLQSILGKNLQPERPGQMMQNSLPLDPSYLGLSPSYTTLLIGLSTQLALQERKLA